jgi:hypothetical protein
MGAAGMRYAKRTDGNHAAIRDALRAIGIGVQDTSSAGCGLPDLICACRGMTVFVEVKNGELSPSRRKLTKAQVHFRDMLSNHGVIVHVVNDVPEALALFGVNA